MSETIAKIRHQHYEEKRRAKLELLEHTLKNGLINNMLQYANTQSKSMNSPGGVSPAKSMYTSSPAFGKTAKNSSPSLRLT